MSQSIYDMDAPAGSGGNFIKIEPGQQVVMRFFGDPLYFRKSFEGREPQDRFATLAIYADKASGTERVGIFEWGWMVQKELKALAKDADWGDPREFWIAVKRDGEGMKTKYTVIPKPKKPLTATQQKLVADNTIDLMTVLKVSAWGALAGDGAPAPASAKGDDDFDPFADE